MGWGLRDTLRSQVQPPSHSAWGPLRPLVPKPLPLLSLSLPPGTVLGRHRAAEAFHGAFSRRPPPRPLCPAAGPVMAPSIWAAQPSPAGLAGPSQAEQVHSGRWWKNVDKFLICNTLGKSLLPLFEDECINKAGRGWRGAADERQKTRNFMAIRSDSNGDSWGTGPW